MSFPKCEGGAKMMRHLQMQGIVGALMYELLVFLQKDDLNVCLENNKNKSFRN